MTIRIRKLDDGYLVTDARGPVLWEGAAVSEADAVVMAESRLNPRLPAPPPGYRPEPSPLATLQYAQATDGAECVGGLCSMD